MFSLRDPYVVRLADGPVDDRVMPVFWVSVGAIVLLVGGIPLFVAWLTPGLPPPGPFG